MDANRKNAYRYLLYQFLIEVRTVPVPPSPQPFDTATFEWLAKRNYYTGAVAYQLHNFGLAVANDFTDFDEEHFWAGLEHFSNQNPEIPLATRYRTVFERRLAELLEK
ncbi:hypothetical protein [Hymenobacter norwichensis]|uniref:hypothetical protein n=1 Tax=Hymenobacter norwichensis TaxID=223903 RepID=UPI00146D652C|nr:hypothetical protein [Hymenobacter norwichensis]